VNIKRIFIISFLFFLIIFDYKSDASNYKFKRTIINSEKKELPAGEELLYRLELFGIPIGWINLKIKEKTLFKGRSCYHIIGQAYSNRFFKKFYDVAYNVDTYIDAETFVSYRFQKQRRLNNQFTKVTVDFNWDKKQIKISDEVDNKQREQLINLNDKTQDLLSSLYYFRLMNIELNGSYDIRIFYGTETWITNIKVKSPQLIDIYRKGSLEAFETEINTELSQIILQTPRLTVYFTNDTKRIPILFYLRFPFGHLRGRIYNLK